MDLEEIDGKDLIPLNSKMLEGIQEMKDIPNIIMHLEILEEEEIGIEINTEKEENQ